ncbi:hypothetical protein E3N88_27878 [Mikania micrantha]|uniref:Uncharacterized protein n=1 Tax=Mikania micrantha TaxID=192012 RepID=A0A5N6MZ22_9ASTR|nr:hypothetical protein E3N88_27878 [Mikania micrantha]
MVNVGENGTRNGVTDCPEAKNEEVFQSIELVVSSRYAKDEVEESFAVREERNVSESSGFLRGDVFDIERSERFNLKCGFEVPAAVGQNLSTAVRRTVYDYDGLTS